MFGLSKNLGYWYANRKITDEVNKMSSSFRTTILGLFLILGALGNAGIAYFDNDPNTKADLKATAATVAAGWGLVMARDQKAHEEDAAKARKF